MDSKNIIFSLNTVKLQCPSLYLNCSLFYKFMNWPFLLIKGPRRGQHYNVCKAFMEDETEGIVLLAGNSNCLHEILRPIAEKRTPRKSSIALDSHMINFKLFSTISLHNLKRKLVKLKTTHSKTSSKI